MKVLMLAPQPFFTPRGTPISVYQRLEACSALGYQVNLLTYHVGQDVAMPGLTICRAWGPKSVKQVPIGPSIIKIFLDIFLFFKAIKLLLTNDYDVIHTHEEAAFMGLILAPLFKVPHLYDMHSRLSQQVAHSRFGWLKPIVALFAWLEKLAVRSGAGVITIGADLAEYVGSIRSKTPYCTIENMAVRSSAVVPENQAQLLAEKYQIDDRLAIVYTGTFESYQGLDLFLDAAKIVCRQRQDVLFVLVGGRPEQVMQWRQKTIEEGVGHAFRFTGVLPLAEAISFLEVADILVSPRIEGLSIPLKIYSYLHSGKPIVATRIEAHTQLLDESIAVLTAKEPAAYADGLLRLLADENLRQEIGGQAASFAQVRFDATSYQERVKLIYEAVVFQNYRVLEKEQTVVIE